MKLLLTSAGISNASIAVALFELVGKPASEISLVFVPTAMHVEEGDKSWFIDDLLKLRKLGLKCIDIADISAVPRGIWQPRLEAADVLYFEGGNTYHLMEWMKRSGLDSLLPSLLESKVYVGSSAGSMVTGRDLSVCLNQAVYGEDFDRAEDVAALGLVDFYFLPHMDSLYFPRRQADSLPELLRDTDHVIYALDDESALKVIDDKVETVSEGRWLRID
jgi:dipeptidase E